MKRYPSVSLVIFLLLVFSLAACGGVAAPTTAAPVAVAATDTPVPPPTNTSVSPTEVPTTAPPTATTAAMAAETPENTPIPPPVTLVPPTPTAEIVAVDWLAVQGRTDDGLPTLGNPDAPVRVIDYSDFL